MFIAKFTLSITSLSNEDKFFMILDLSIVLRTKQEPNKYLAEDLFAQFKAQGITLKEDSAYVLPLFTLKLMQDSKSNYKY